MDLPGYAGHILYVDLTRGKVNKEPLDPELVKEFIGGWGITNRLAYDLIPPNTDPLSAENCIIIGTGPFTGTIVPAQQSCSSQVGSLSTAPMPPPAAGATSP